MPPRSHERRPVPLPRWNFLEAELEIDRAREGEIKRMARDLHRLDLAIRSGAVPLSQIAKARRDLERGRAMLAEVRDRANMVAPPMLARMLEQSRWRPARAQPDDHEAFGELAGAMIAARNVLSILIGVVAPNEGTFSAANVPKVVLHEQLVKLMHEHESHPLPPLEAAEHELAERMQDRLLPANRVVLRVPPMRISAADIDEPIQTTDFEVYAIRRDTLIRDAARIGRPDDAEALGAFHPATSFFVVWELNRKGPEGQPTPQLIWQSGPKPADARWHHLPLHDEHGAISAIFTRLLPGLLEFWNEPHKTLLRRIGMRFVMPLEHARRQNVGPAQRIRYEYWGERIRVLDAPLARYVGGEPRPIEARYFVRGHWTRWPMLPAHDPIREVAQRAIRELQAPRDDEGIDGSDLALFTEALHARIGAELDLSRRTYDVVTRLLCTWDIENAPTPGLHPLLDCPWWDAHRDRLWPQLREQARRRRSYRMPHWRGPDDGAIHEIVTIVAPEGAPGADWRGES